MIGLRKFLGGILLLLAAAAWGEINIDVSGSVEWERMEINAAMALDLDGAGLRLPTGRAQAEELLSQESPDLLRSYILAVPVDSSSTLEDLVRRGEFPFRNVEDLILSSPKTPSAFSVDLRRLSTTYTVDLAGLSTRLIRHSRAIEVSRPIRPAPAAVYTGIVIIANGELPIHGKRTAALVRPCLFPKVWDTDMRVIYERNIMEPARGSSAPIVRYVTEASVFQNGPTGLTEELISLVGTNPLRILAQGVFGILPTDPIIDREDALTILSSEENRRLLREGRVAVVLDESVLRSVF